jgi:hypothetical protein
MAYPVLPPFTESYYRSVRTRRVAFSQFFLTLPEKMSPGAKAGTYLLL